MACKKGTDGSSKSHLASLVENDGLLPGSYDGLETTDVDRKLLMSMPIPIEPKSRRENLALKNLMDLANTLVETITKYVIKRDRLKNQYILDNDDIRAHIMTLLEDGVGCPGELTMAVDKLLRRPRGINGAGFLMMKQELDRITDFTEYDIVLIYLFIIELLNRTPEIPVDDAVHPDVLANAAKFVGIVPTFLLRKILLCSDISHNQRLTMAAAKITQLDLWTQTTSMAHQIFYGPIHDPKSGVAQKLQEHALSFFHLCYIVQRRNGFQRKKKKDDGSSDKSDDETDASAHQKKPQWFT